MSGLDVLIVGAGPAGLATAIAAKKKGLSASIVERGVLVNTILRFPTNMVFFTTPELLEIGGLPFTTPHEKPTRFEALRYYRRVVDTYDLDIQMGQEVVRVERPAGTAHDGAAPGGDAPGGDAHHVVTVRDVRPGASGTRELRARAVVLATGAFDEANVMGVPGEELPHVSHYYTESHPFYRKNVVIIGGQNSAVEAALDLFRSGVKRVTLVHRQPVLGASIKYWVKPDIENRIKEGSIHARMNARVVRISHESVLIEQEGRTEELPADGVFLLTGYHSDVRLFEAAGVTFDATTYAPSIDEQTYETNVPGLYVVGNATTGRQSGKIFIENGRFHGTHVIEVIADRLAAARAGLHGATASELG